MNTKLNTIKLLSVLALLVFGLNANAQIQNQIQIHVHSDGGDNPKGLKSTIGTQNMAEGNYSLAAGMGNQAKGQTSFAIGYYNIAENLNSIAIGMYTKCQADYGITIGRGYNYASPLLNNTGGIMLGIYSNVPTLFISKSGGMNRTGKVAIGNTTNPEAKLHIKADNLEHADIMLEPNQNYDASILFRNTDCFIKVDKSGKMTINVPNKPVFFNASKYYINSNYTYIENNEDTDFKIKVPNNMNIDANYVGVTGKVGINMENTSEDLDVAIDKGVYAPNGFTLDCHSRTQKNPIKLQGRVFINTSQMNIDDWFSLVVEGGILTEQVLIKSHWDWPDFVFASDYKLMPLSELKSYIQDNHHLPDVPSESQVSEQGFEVGEMQSVLLKKIEELTLYTIQLQEQCEKQQKLIDCLEQRIGELETASR